jgi:hypothetical protein
MALAVGAVRARLRAKRLDATNTRARLREQWDTLQFRHRARRVRVKFDDQGFPPSMKAAGAIRL